MFAKFSYLNCTGFPGPKTTNYVCLFSWRGCIFHSPLAGFSFFILEVSSSHTPTRHRRYDSSGRVINLSQRPLRYNTQHSQQTNIHAPGGIRTHNISRRAAVELRLRPRGHWDPQNNKLYQTEFQ